MNSGLVMIVCLLALAAAREDCPTCSAGGAAAEDDEVSLLQAAHIKRHLQHAPDTYNGGVDGGILVNASELLAESTVLHDEMGKSSCATRRCNPIECGTSAPLAGTYAPHLASLNVHLDTVQKISSPYCQKAFGTATCCKEKYGSLAQNGANSYYFLRKPSRGSNLQSVCASCKALDVAGFAEPVTLYFMRHAEGCHNLKAGSNAASKAASYHSHKSLPMRGGHYDAPLTQEGLDQAEAAGATLFGLAANIDDVIVSPMRRAQQTYAIAAIGSVALAAKPTNVAPYACEGGSYGPENTPTAPDFQECLFNEDDNAVPAVGGIPVVWPDVHRCITWNTLSANGGAGAPMDTCTNGGTRRYEEEPKAEAAQDFADWLTMEFAGRTVLLIGHSNWARSAGIVNPDGSKVNWASIHHLTIRPGGTIREDAAGVVQDYAGTARNAGSNHLVGEDARCQADVTWVQNCKAHLGHRLTSGKYKGL